MCPQTLPPAPFVRTVSLKLDKLENGADLDAYPFSLPAVRALEDLRLSPVTYFVGENGSGKSTVLEALAVASGFNAEGGTVNFSFATRKTESELHGFLRIARTGARPKSGFFLRAESFYNVATEIERLGVEGSYGDRSLHEQSHGESFLALIQHRFGPQGLYLLDEPEAALSPARQLTLLIRIHELVESGSQFVIATHSPIVLAYPHATIYTFDAKGIHPAAYDDTEQVTLTRDFLNNRQQYLQRLFAVHGEPE